MTNNNTMIARTFEVVFLVSAFVLPGCAADAASELTPPAAQTWKEIAPSELRITPAKPEAQTPKPKESAQPPPADPLRTESRTPETGAAARAADPKDPSGAIIIKAPPTGAGNKP